MYSMGLQITPQCKCTTVTGQAGILWVNIAILFFLCAVVCVAHSPVIVDFEPLLVGLPLAVFGLGHRHLRPLSGFFLGALFSLYTANVRLDSELPVLLEGVELQVTGMVVGLPRSTNGNIRFRFRVDNTYGLEQGSSPTPDQAFTGLVVLSCYRCPVNPVPGDEWQFTIKLSRPTGSVNPGMFDYEGWLFMQEIVGTGYVRNPDTAIFLGRNPVVELHNRLRMNIRDFIHKATINNETGVSDYPGLLTALTIGDSSGISSADWQLLSKTGTNHLFVISGLHVGLVAGIIYKLLTFLPLPIRWVGLLTVLLTGCYSALAGFGLPAQRAFIMTAIVALATSMRRRMDVRTMFCMALLGVLLMEVYAVLSVGFWLSFGAVFSLLYAFAARPFMLLDTSVFTRVKQAVRTQWVVTLGMMPWLLFLLYQFSLMSLPTNMFVIPWVSILVIPPLLVIQVMIPVFPSLAAQGIQLVEFTLGIAWQVIEFAASFDLVYYRSPLNLPVLVISLVGVMSLLAPRGLFPRWVSLFCLLPLFNFIPTEIKPLQITFLDVGQGLSVLVQTPGQVILYDTGPAFRSGFNAGEQIVVPYLRSRGIREIDHLIVSHSDNDHSGGFSAIIRNLPVDKAYASDQDFLPDTVSCVTPSTWKADELVFSIFAINEPADANNQSCLLQITGQGIAVLLTGDIESQAESILVASDLPTMDLISVPHHGSATSSTPGFLNKLRPGVVVVSSGINNRFNHPDPKVIQRYRLRHARVINTATAGAVLVRFDSGGHMEISLARDLNPRLWSQPMESGPRNDY